MKFISMDAHSRNSYFVVLGKSGKLLQRKRVKTQEDEIIAFVRSVNGPKRLVFEEGVMSQWLYLLLKDEVDELVVCRPAKSEGSKTDWKDCIENAELLMTGKLKTVFHSDDVLMNLRVLISGYDDVIEELKRTKNRYKAIYREVAIPTKETDFYESIEHLALLPTKERHYVGCTLLEQLFLLEEQRNGYLERFEENVRTYKPIKLLTSIPGIGTIRANQIVGIMVTPHRFPRKYNLFSYAKLTKHNRQSDQKLYGRKRPKGQPILKDIFKSSVLSAIQGNTSFQRRYKEMRSKGKGDRAARNHVAKMIAATVLGVWKTGKSYDDKHMEVTRRRNQRCHRDTENL